MGRTEAARTRRTDQGPWRLSGQDWREPLGKKHKRSASTVVATKRLERDKVNDIEMVDDIVTAPGGQVHTALAQLKTARMTRKTEQDLVMKALAEKEPDTLVTLSAKVSEHEADTRVDIEESITFGVGV